MTILRWSKDALEDMERLYDFTAAHSADAAEKAIAAILSAAITLRNFPQAGRCRPSNRHFRELPVRFGAKGYVVRYRIFEDEVIIIRVWHALEDRQVLSR